MNQKLSDLASLAEIVGSVAVIVTLIVLILEIRGNTEEIRSTALTNLSGRTQTLLMTTIANAALMEANAKEAQGEELSYSEESILDQALALRMKYAEESFMAYRDGRLEDEVWRTRANLLLDSLAGEADRRRWASRQGRGWYIQGFVDWVNYGLSERYGESWGEGTREVTEPRL